MTRIYIDRGKSHMQQGELNNSTGFGMVSKVELSTKGAMIQFFSNKKDYTYSGSIR
jgi:hypothetical protein